MAGSRFSFNFCFPSLRLNSTCFIWKTASEVWNFFIWAVKKKIRFQKNQWWMSTLDAVENWEGISFLVAAGITWSLSFHGQAPEKTVASSINYIISMSMPDDLCHCPIYHSFINTTSSDPGTCASRAGNISICKSEVEASISINASEAPKCNASAICFAMPVRECLIFSFWPARIFAKTSWDPGECARKVPFLVVLLSVDTAWNPAIQHLINVSTPRPHPTPSMV